ncbi:ImmA/IrrE family metallo-endopeptidase [Bradyrhizobium sp. UNPA324]|uniref:ImmA/IrrE family metallo-endopeptidase n=1 Tax=Bradyrhizobium sp. UNPA324 TaxID=1141174 RepID=UPI00114F594A|nr:ImmA/IrrE family metallo-endopeptidase [Bradyrhizobium sp. UNPA324]TQF29749.1 hypothetical protein UNPA324_09080 [Bradyrhizobium sp. UNPA324]
MSARASTNPSQAALDILQRNNIRTAPVPVDKIARTLGALVRFSPLHNDISGMIYIKDNIPIIGVNALHHPNRQRFTIAHECGHLVLHRPMITTQVHVDKEFPSVVIRQLNRDSRSALGTDDVEIQANRFAAELLMPRAFLETELRKTFDVDDSTRIEKLAKQFRVSKEAMGNRLSALFSSFSG